MFRVLRNDDQDGHKNRWTLMNALINIKMNKLQSAFRDLFNFFYRNNLQELEFYEFYELDDFLHLFFYFY